LISAERLAAMCSERENNSKDDKNCDSTIFLFVYSRMKVAFFKKPEIFPDQNHVRRAIGE
jgi:hypothetical protein